MNAGKRLIFTVSTGRSGTAYLTHLMKDLPDIRAEHEPAPHFQSMLPRARFEPELAKDFLGSSKLPYIQAQPESTYVETSHYVGKGFIEPMLEKGIGFDLILFGRNPRQVASSWFLIGASIKAIAEGRLSLRIIGPNEPNFLPVKGWRDWNDYQLCYWYSLENYFRCRHYADLLSRRGRKTLAISLEQLATDEGYRQLLAWLGIESAVLENRIADHRRRSIVLNDKSKIKNSHSRAQELAGFDLDALEAQVRAQTGIGNELNSRILTWQLA